MNIIFSTSALDKINDVAEFIDDINTDGAGDRWVERLFQFIATYSQLSNVSWPLCKHSELAAMGYSCATYNRIWVIVFRIENNNLKVYDFLNGSLLFQAAE